MFWARVVGAIGLGLFLLSAFTPLPNVLSRWAATPPRVQAADAIVVLGGGLWPDGSLSNASLRRALQGIVLHRKGFAPVLVFLGPGVDGELAEAEVRSALARDLGTARDAILAETGALTTREEAARVKALLVPKGVRRILLVTDSHHLARARSVFEGAGFEVLPAPADDTPNSADQPESRLKLMRRVAEELLARLYYRLARYL
jgi:uncharacterized SAM-binding protein YcdF (DUF218 family)